MERNSFRRHDAVMVREIDGELVPLDTRSNRVHQLNRTASVIWRMAENEGAATEQIAAALVLEFAVTYETAMNDVVETLTMLRSLDLLASG